MAQPARQRSIPSLVSIAPEAALQALSEGHTVVTANRRLVRMLRGQYDRAQAAGGAEAWAGADILSWEDWSRRCWEDGNDLAALAGDAGEGPREGAGEGAGEKAGDSPGSAGRCLSPGQAELVWEEVIAASPHGRSLPTTSGTTTSGTASEAMAAWDLLQAWRLPIPVVSPRGTLENRAFSQWAMEYQRLCAERGWMDETAIPEQLAGFFASGLVSPPNRLILAGFDDFTPRQQHLLEALSTQGASLEEIVWPERAVHSVRLPFPDQEGEVLGAARWAKTLLEANPERRIGIVVPELPRLRSLIAQVFEDLLAPASVLPGASRHGLPFNISLGLPLSDYPLVATALGLLSLSPGMQGWEKVNLLFHTPFLPGWEAERDARASLESRLRKRGGEGVSLATVQAFSDPPKAAPGQEHPPERANHDKGAPSGHVHAPLLGAALGRWRKRIGAIERRLPPSGWAVAFSSLLEALGWPGDRPLDSAEFQTREKWNRLLEALARLDPAARPMTHGEALSLLARMAASEIFQPESPDAPIQVLGVLEAAGLECDHLWVMGLHDGAWPPNPRPNAFLPAALQRRHDMPHASPEHNLAAARMVMSRLDAASADRVAGYPAMAEERAVAPSPLIAHFPESTLDALGVKEAPLYLEHLAGFGTLESYSDFQAPSLPPGMSVSGGTALFAEQAACPFRAFARFRLHAESPVLPEAGMTPMERGTLAHKALERAWGRIASHAALCALDAGELRQRTEAAAGEALADFLEGRADRMGERETTLELERLSRLLMDWLELEKQRQPFQVEQRETEIAFEIGGISGTGRIDRIDLLEDGKRIILDYKTGALKSNAWMGDRPDEPQLPLYCVSADFELGGVAFAGLKRGSIGFMGLAEDEAQFPKARPFDLAADPGGEPFGSKAALLNRWKQVLESLGRSYRGGDARAMPKNIATTCRHCHLPTLCRIAELSREYGQFATENTENNEHTEHTGNTGAGGRARGGGQDE
ncbi:MAG: PD-(D/E)XK nuclease family protein [SAR324 cluster bacterium]|nr:PD-(D/E)XK nuclease family protein [SAR324 cluster bacterium]